MNQGSLQTVQAGYALVMSLVLVGYRGSGKTSVGRIVAERIAHTFVDTDELIVASAGVPIHEIFSRRGESHFRDLESAVLQQALSMPSSVISTGGGIIVREQNRVALRQAGRRVVYLYASAETLHARITGDVNSATNRPHLTALGGGLEEVQHLLAIRDPLYREVAGLVIDVTLLAPAEVAEAILRTCEATGHNR